MAVPETFETTLAPLAARVHYAKNEPGQAARTLDGAWWPRSRELAREVPLLVSTFAERGLRITRIVYHPRLWLVAPSKVRVNGQAVHLGWFREIDPNLVSLRTSENQRIELLVIPPEASADAAARASEVAIEPSNRTSPTDVLITAGAEPVIA